MPDYNTIRNICRHTQHLTASVIDEFLIYYAANRHKLDREAEKQLARYRHLNNAFPVEWVNMSIAQYISH